MSLGKAILTTAVGQNEEYIVDGESGILAPPGDEWRFGQELERLLEDPELRARLGRNAEKRINERFSWDGVALDGCLAAYQLLAKA
jgi:glycosyltransferase involved in cell wall biosynthesis